MKTCPFCGSIPVEKNVKAATYLYGSNKVSIVDDYTEIACDSKLCFVKPSVRFPDREKAVAAWERRK